MTSQASIRSPLRHASRRAPRLRIGLLLTLLSLSAVAFGQSDACPTLPADSGLRWETIQPDGLVFCRALDGNGREAFAVTISTESSFRPRRSKREERTVINGQSVWWYSAEVASGSVEIVRETLLELADRRVAHIMIRVNTEDDLADNARIVSALRF